MANDSSDFARSMAIATSGLRAQARPPLLLAHHTPRQVSPVVGASPAPLCATAKPELISLLHKMKPQMNTDKHKQQSRNQKNLTTKTRRREENPLRFRGEQDACAPRRTHKSPFQVAKNFQYRVVQVRVRLCSSWFRSCFCVRCGGMCFNLVV